MLCKWYYSLMLEKKSCLKYTKTGRSQWTCWTVTVDLLLKAGRFWWDSASSFWTTFSETFPHTLSWRRSLHQGTPLCQDRFCLVLRVVVWEGFTVPQRDTGKCHLTFVVLGILPECGWKGQRGTVLITFLLCELLLLLLFVVWHHIFSCDGRFRFLFCFTNLFMTLFTHAVQGLK